MIEQPTKPSEGIKAGLLKVLLGGTGGGAGVAIVYFAYDLLRQNPAMFGELLKDWGQGFVLAVGILWMGHTYLARAQQFHTEQLGVARESAKSFGELAAAVERVAKRDDTYQVAIEAAVGRVAGLQHSTLERLDALGIQMKEHLENSVKHAGEYEHRLEKVEEKLGLQNS